MRMAKNNGYSNQEMLRDQHMGSMQHFFGFHN